jgi:hypothetical protein
MFNLLSFLYLACAAPSGLDLEHPVVHDTMVAAGPVEPPTLRSAPGDGSIDMPPAAQGIAYLLNAHHAEDLPTRAELDAHLHAEAGLHWLATQSGTLGTQARALGLLSLYPSDATMALVDRRLVEPDLHPMLRAAGLNAVGGWPLSARAARVGMLRDALRSADVAVVVSAARAARGLPELTEEVEQMRTGHPSTTVRELLSMPMPPK